jgi:hypothetical protein
MARKDERSTRVRQASGEFNEGLSAVCSRRAHSCDKRDLRNIVSIVILCDLRVKVGTRG